MTPEEKAKELIDKYFNVGDQEFDYSKEFSLIAVDEILKTRTSGIEFFYYWDEVKNEIKKL
jgi:hypothetical protein